MTIPTHPPRQGRRTGDGWAEPAPGDQPRLSVVTRLLFEDPAQMPLGMDGRPKNAAAAVDTTTGAWILLFRNDLTVAVRKAELKKLRAELRHAGAGRLTAHVLLAAAGVHQIGGTYLRMRLSGVTQDVRDAVIAHAGAAAMGTVAVIGATVAAGAIAGSGHGPAGVVRGSPEWHHLHPVYNQLLAKPLAYLGAYEAGNEAGSYAQMEQFGATIGRTPNVALDYLGWDQRFPAEWANTAAVHGAIPFLELNLSYGTPSGRCGCGVSLNAIINGDYDGYLTRLADAAASYRKNVIIGIGHEFNGDWYPWGWGHADPLEFAAAWRHIVDVFRYQGSYNITWCWVANEAGGPHATGSLAAWWPGKSYVNWVGVDGYYEHLDDSFGSVFSPTIADIRAVTSDPLLISETAIGPAGTEPWQLDDLFAAVERARYLGVVWFDANKPGKPYRLENNLQSTKSQQIVAVFQNQTRAWRLAHQHGPAKSSTSG